MSKRISLPHSLIPANSHQRQDLTLPPTVRYHRTASGLHYKVYKNFLSSITFGHVKCWTSTFTRQSFHPPHTYAWRRRRIPAHNLPIDWSTLHGRTTQPKSVRHLPPVGLDARITDYCHVYSRSRPYESFQGLWLRVIVWKLLRQLPSSDVKLAGRHETNQISRMFFGPNWTCFEFLYFSSSSRLITTVSLLCIRAPLLASMTFQWSCCHWVLSCLISLRRSCTYPSNVDASGLRHMLIKHDANPFEICLKHEWHWIVLDMHVS